VVQDAVGKTIMYSKNQDAKLMPASITKIMTALVALDHWSDLNTVIEVKNEDRAIGQTIKLEKGEGITLKNILYGLLVHSGNDAALAVADNYCAPNVAKGEVGTCGYSAFVDAMNTKAKDLHLDNTTFKNPSGVEQYGHLTTARDLAILAATALQNPVIAEMAQTQRIVITDVTGVIVHDLGTTNELLGVLPGLKGLKTGWTTNAGECLVSYVDRDGHKIILVVLGSLDRFGDTTKLVDWRTYITTGLPQSSKL
jgi:D-alanyl-D-alanine carboxypeptidase